jgi:hypothetical protein
VCWSSCLFCSERENIIFVSTSPSSQEHKNEICSPHSSERISNKRCPFYCFCLPKYIPSAGVCSFNLFTRIRLLAAISCLTICLQLVLYSCFTNTSSQLGWSDSSCRHSSYQSCKSRSRLLLVLCRYRKWLADLKLQLINCCCITYKNGNTQNTTNPVNSKVFSNNIGYKIGRY